MYSRDKGIAFTTASILLLSAGTTACAQPKQDEIQGMVHMPAGHDVRGTYVITCPEPFDNCNAEGRKTAVLATGPVRDRAAYRVTGLDPAKRYQVVAHKDLDGDKDASPGDLLGGIAAAATGITPGTTGASITLSELKPRSSTAPVAGAAQAAGTGGPTGRWTQRSSATESTLTSKLKLVPRTGGGIGMDTRSVMEYTPVRVDRAMTLDVQPGGGFTWSIQLKKPHGQGCFMTTRQEKRGRLSVSGGKMTFATTGGTQSTTNSCTGRTDTAPAPAMSETYDFSRSGGSLHVRGTGGVHWTFARG